MALCDRCPLPNHEPKLHRMTGARARKPKPFPSIRATLLDAPPLQTPRARFRPAATGRYCRVFTSRTSLHRFLLTDKSRSKLKTGALLYPTKLAPTCNTVLTTTGPSTSPPPHTSSQPHQPPPLSKPPSPHPPAAYYLQAPTTAPSPMAALTRRTVNSPLSKHLPHLRILSTPATPPPPQTPPPNNSTTIAQYLGYFGALPFLAGGIATSLTHHPILATSTQLYGATILSFLGGVHWGHALHRPLRTDFVYAVTPSLVGCTAALLHPPEGLPLLMGGFATAWLYDEVRFAKEPEAVQWYRRLRRPLSVAAVVGCGLAWRGVGMRAGRRREEACLRDADPVVVSVSPVEHASQLSGDGGEGGV